MFLLNFLSLNNRTLWLGSSIVMVSLGIILLLINVWILNTPVYHLLISGSSLVGLAGLVYISFIIYDIFH